MSVGPFSVTKVVVQGLVLILAGESTVITACTEGNQIPHNVDGSLLAVQITG